METGAIYCRVSTEDQEREGSSLHSQRDACLAKAAELGFAVPPDYVYLETWTGADTDRPKLNELRNLIRHRLVGCVVCYATDRLARNPIHIAIIAEECEKRGIGLVFVTEPLDNSPEGALIRYVKGFAGQVEREKIRERTMRGKREKAREGKLSTGGPRLFGYQVADGKRTISEEPFTVWGAEPFTESGLVKRIFAWFACEGYTLYRAAAELNRAGVLAPRGGKWSEHTVRRMLINPAYKGVTYAFRYQVVAPQRPKKDQRPYAKTTHVLRDKKDWVEIPNATPAIVEPAVWDMAQAQLARNKLKSPRNRKHQYLLTNSRLRCGVCGHAMVGSCKKKPKGDRLYYRCVCNVKAGYYAKCPQHSIAAGAIEPLVWGEIAKVLKDPALVLAELDKRRGVDTETILETERFLAEGTIKHAEDAELRYLRQYGQGIITEKLLHTEVIKIKQGREAAEAKLAELIEQQQALKDANARYDKVNDALAVLTERLDNANYELKLLAMDALDIVVTLQPDGNMFISGSIPEEVQLSYTMS